MFQYLQIFTFILEVKLDIFQKFRNMGRKGEDFLSYKEWTKIHWDFCFPEKICFCVFWARGKTIQKCSSFFSVFICTML